MIEFLCGLIGIVVLFSMLLQIGMISFEHTRIVVSARNAVAQAMTGNAPLYSPDYLSGWETGHDENPYTEDDVAKSGNSGLFLDTLSTAMKLSELEAVAPTNRFSDFLHTTSGGVVGTFDIFRIMEQTDPIEILPGVGRFVVDKDFLLLTHEIYMPWIDNIMD